GEAGAVGVSGIALHLRGEVRGIFMDWLRSYRPDLVDRYEGLYARGAYAPREEQDRLRRRIPPGPAPAGQPPPPPPPAPSRRRRARQDRRADGPGARPGTGRRRARLAGEAWPPLPPERAVGTDDSERSERPRVRPGRQEALF